MSNLLIHFTAIFYLPFISYLVPVINYLLGTPSPTFWPFIRPLSRGWTIHSLHSPLSPDIPGSRFWSIMSFMYIEPGPDFNKTNTEYQNKFDNDLITTKYDFTSSFPDFTKFGVTGGPSFC